MSIFARAFKFRGARRVNPRPAPQRRKPRPSVVGMPLRFPADQASAAANAFDEYWAFVLATLDQLKMEDPGPTSPLVTMQLSDAWNRKIQAQSIAIQQAAESLARKLGEIYGVFPVLQAAMRPGVAVSNAPFFTIEGWGQWRAGLFVQGPAIQNPQAIGWQEFQERLGEKNLGVLIDQSYGSFQKFAIMIAALSGIQSQISSPETPAYSEME